MNNSIVDAMLRHGIGLNPWFFDRIEGKPKFPPHNVIKLSGSYPNSDEHYRLTLAVAGYEPDELKVVLLDETLTISGNKKGSVEKVTGETVVPDEPNHQVLYRGIAYRNFTSEFVIGPNINIDNVSLRNGLLNVDFVRSVPETAKPKEFSISAA